MFIVSNETISNTVDPMTNPAMTAMAFELDPSVGSIFSNPGFNTVNK